MTLTRETLDRLTELMAGQLGVIITIGDRVTTLSNEQFKALLESARANLSAREVDDAMIERAQTAFIEQAHQPNGMHDPHAAWEAALHAAMGAKHE